LNCSLGGFDSLYGGPGDVDYLVGGSHSDYIEGNSGPDLVFGDHASITLYADVSHKLKYATTTHAGCGGSSDSIILGRGDDIVSKNEDWIVNVFFYTLIFSFLKAFGGASSDYIEGNDGQDIIFGDFGIYDAEVEFLPYQHYQSIIAGTAFAGNDTIDGGAGDDFLMGQEVRIEKVYYAMDEVSYHIY